jgi:uncharacterized protein YuzE
MKKTKIHYDKKSDVLYFVLKSGPADYAEEISDGVTIEYGKDDKPIGIEIFRASEVVGEKLVKKASSNSSVSA